MKCGFCNKDINPETDEYIKDTYWRGDGTPDEETAFCNYDHRDKAREVL